MKIKALLFFIGIFAIPSISNAAAEKVVKKRYDVNWRMPKPKAGEAKEVFDDMSRMERFYLEAKADTDLLIDPSELIKNVKAGTMTAESAIKKMEALCSARNYVTSTDVDGWKDIALYWRLMYLELDNASKSAAAQSAPAQQSAATNKSVAE